MEGDGQRSAPKLFRPYLDCETAEKTAAEPTSQGKCSKNTSAETGSTGDGIVVDKNTSVESARSITDAPCPSKAEAASTRLCTNTASAGGDDGLVSTAGKAAPVNTAMRSEIQKMGFSGQTAPGSVGASTPQQPTSAVLQQLFQNQALAAQLQFTQILRFQEQEKIRQAQLGSILPSSVPRNGPVPTSPVSAVPEQSLSGGGAMRSSAGGVSNRPHPFMPSNPVMQLSDVITREARRRMKTIDPENMYIECPVCHKRIKRLYHFQRHMRIHSGEKQHQCPLCPYKSVRKDNLKSHLKTHDKHRQASLIPGVMGGFGRTCGFDASPPRPSAMQPNMMNPNVTLGQAYNQALLQQIAQAQNMASLNFRNQNLQSAKQVGAPLPTLNTVLAQRASSNFMGALSSPAQPPIHPAQFCSPPPPQPQQRRPNASHFLLQQQTQNLMAAHMACGVQGPSYGKHATPTSSSSSPISTGGSGLGVADGSGGGPTEFATSMAAVLASALNQGMFGATPTASDIVNNLQTRAMAAADEDEEVDVLDEDDIPTNSKPTPVIRHSSASDLDSGTIVSNGKHREKSVSDKTGCLGDATRALTD